MDTIEHWKHLTRQANDAFEKECNAVAESLYKRSLSLMQQALENQPGLVQVICLSVSVQNLADLYARQGRWQRCFTILETYRTRFDHAAESLDCPPSVGLSLIQESCRLRREILRHQHEQSHPHTLPDRSWVSSLPMTERVH
ncbi:hypothetical protein ADINL_0204 [Nitrincola lacisaponensis]|uniref:Uncharacterized protein n=1 Tax=Nitrincola lacisaponensis TaxID=267850 RepID=A0A063Y8R3_9GAMM|nr:hypothetical protein [Nitrincola lacisaponensis]KDE41131.1 hypothetical protein ADINL_0204 [Nitrincola lacisaponensis]